MHGASFARMILETYRAHGSDGVVMSMIMSRCMEHCSHDIENSSRPQLRWCNHNLMIVLRCMELCSHDIENSSSPHGVIRTS